MSGWPALTKPRHGLPVGSQTFASEMDWLPPARTVIEFRHTAPKAQTIWFVLDHGDVSVCHIHPGFEVDVYATATTAAFADVFQGLVPWDDAIETGSIEVMGPPRLVRALPRWFLWSPWRDVTHERSKRAAKSPADQAS